MGKGDLWDDSALIKAFDNAISKYKKMHGTCGVTDGEMIGNNTEELLPAAEAGNGGNGFCSNTERVQNDDNIKTTMEATDKIGETANFHLLQIKENPSLVLDSSKHVDSSNSHTGNVAPVSETSAPELGSSGNQTVSLDAQSQNEATWCCSIVQEDYNQLLNKYYEIEDQRQNILHQLNQFSYLNYQNPVSGTSTSEEYQESLTQPYDTVTCHCSYGCQNWVVPCCSLPASSSGLTCTDRSCGTISKGAPKGNSISHEEPDFVEMALDAAKRALSSLTQEASTKADVFANEGKDRDFGMEIAHSTESSKPATDLAAVLNAWFSAGLYTGKYLSEQQSAEKRKHHGV